MQNVAERLENLSDQQVLFILDAIAAEISSPDSPEGTAAQVEALQSIFGEGSSVDLQRAAQADPATAAQAARELLLIMSQTPELRSRIEDWLADPPKQEAAAIPLLLAAPVVFTACVAFLQVIGHSRFERKPDGRWTFAYDPRHKTPFDDTMPQTVGTIGKMMTGMALGK